MERSVPGITNCHPRRIVANSLMRRLREEWNYDGPVSTLWLGAITRMDEIASSIMK